MASLSNFLKIMILISALFLIAGGAIFLSYEGREKPQYHDFNSIIPDKHGITLIKTGIILLSLTPLLTMVFSAIFFLRKKDLLYFFLTIFVIIILTSSMYFAKTLDL